MNPNAPSPDVSHHDLRFAPAEPSDNVSADLCEYCGGPVEKARRNSLSCAGCAPLASPGYRLNYHGSDRW
jgi:hypothetical protein